MVTVLSRPIGHKLDLAINDATISNSGGSALVSTMLPHGLVDGAYVYVESDFDSYNGYKSVNVIGPTSFKLMDNLSDHTPFKQNANIVFTKSVLDHGYSAVHLPIVYELHSNKYPNNELDESYSPRTVTSQSSENGYTVLNLSLDIYDPRKLGWIILNGDGPLAGPYQIIDFDDANSPVITLAYNPDNDFSPYLVEQYYYNYFIGVNVYAGLDTDHRWESLKPFTKIGTLKFVPDSNGNVKFSISELLKSQMELRNNLTLDTLPNNLDFFSEFYIEYFESYDISDNTSISTFTSDVTTDTFVGQAINAKLPFKALDSGFMSDYINYGDQYAQWLTLQERPLAVVGYYSDLSFINTQNMVNVIITILKRFEGYTYGTDTIIIDEPGKGVLRIPITAENGFDEYCIQAKTPETTIEIPIPPAEFDLSTFTETNYPGNGAWNLSHSDPNAPWYLDVSGVGPSDPTIRSRSLGTPFIFIVGDSYTFGYAIDFDLIPATTFPCTIYFIQQNSDGTGSNLVYSQTFNTSGHYEDSFTFISSVNRDRIAIYVERDARSESTINWIFYLRSVSHGAGTTETVTIPGIKLTEQLCIDIVDECDTYTSGNARLTEGGETRILE